MAIKRLVPEPIEIELVSSFRVAPEIQQAREVPGGLYPMQARAFEMDEYRLMNGWPVSVPRHDIRVNTLISAGGEVISDRVAPVNITTNADLRWVADPNTFDETGLQWNPTQGGGVSWKSSVTWLPTLISDYEYRVRSERFTVNALNFDSDSRNHMWADFAPLLGNSTGFTVIFVMSPNSTYGNNLAVPYNGLWGPGEPTSPGPDVFSEPPTDTWQELTMQGRYLWVEGNKLLRARTISVNPELTSNVPLMLAVVFGVPQIYLYAGPGPTAIRSYSQPSGSQENRLAAKYVLGRSNGDVQHTADMALMDLGVYSTRLSAAAVADEFATLAQAYGGDT